jgi:hypothetical protein
MEQSQTSKIESKRVEEKQASKVLTIPQDRVDISEEGRALAELSESSTAENSSGDNATNTEDKAQKGGKPQGPPPPPPKEVSSSTTEGVSSTTSTTEDEDDSISSVIEATIDALQEKIDALEKEIAKKRITSLSDEKGSEELQGKESLLVSYQAQLASLETESS